MSDVRQSFNGRSHRLIGEPDARFDLLVLGIACMAIAVWLAVRYF